MVYIRGKLTEAPSLWSLGEPARGRREWRSLRSCGIDGTEIRVPKRLWTAAHEVARFNSLLMMHPLVGFSGLRAARLYWETYLRDRRKGQSFETYADSIAGAIARSQLVALLRGSEQLCDREASARAIRSAILNVSTTITASVTHALVAAYLGLVPEWQTELTAAMMAPANSLATGLQVCSSHLCRQYSPDWMEQMVRAGDAIGRRCVSECTRCGCRIAIETDSPKARVLALGTAQWNIHADLLQDRAMVHADIARVVRRKEQKHLWAKGSKRHELYPPWRGRHERQIGAKRKLALSVARSSQANF
jgi:hypothetical protein